MEKICGVVTKVNTTMRDKQEHKLSVLCGTERVYDRGAMADLGVKGSNEGTPEVGMLLGPTAFPGDAEVDVLTNLLRDTQMALALQIQQASRRISSKALTNIAGVMRSHGATTGGLNTVSQHVLNGNGLEPNAGSGFRNNDNRLGDSVRRQATFLDARESTCTVGETTAGLNTVVNLSRRDLTDGEVSLLSKGF